MSRKAQTWYEVSYICILLSKFPFKLLFGLIEITEEFGMFISHYPLNG